MSKLSVDAKIEFILGMINYIDKNDLKEDKEGAYYTRNYIVHDYEGVDLGFIESILRDYLPSLKNKLTNIKI